MSRRSLLVPFLLLAIPAALFAKPPWISIELPANPWNEATRGAFLVVHTYHFNRPMAGTVSGTAVGVVNGERRTIPLTLEPLGGAGDYAVRNQWGTAGRWVLIITVSQGTAENLAQAVIRIAEGGAVLGVQVPTRQDRNAAVPRRVTEAEIEVALRS